MNHKHTTMTVTKEALIVRIPWDELASRLRPKTRRTAAKLTIDDILNFVREGRKAHREGKTRLIESLSDIR